MIVCGFLQRLKVPLLFVLSLLAIAIAQWFIPPATAVNTLYSPVVRVLLIPGQTGVLKVLYPIIPWLGISLWGVIFGKLLLTKKQTAIRVALGFSLCLLAFFGTVHLLFGAGDFHAPASQTWMGYLTLTKYPPSMMFISLTMGVNLLLLFGISQIKNQNNVAAKLLSGFGRVPFFFYILHLAFFTLVGTFTLYFTITYPLLYLFWLLSLALFYPLCIWFGKLKAKAPPEALIRFF